MIDPKADEAAIRASLDQGFRAIKIKIGGGTLERDVATVSAVRTMIGPDIRLMVDYNQSLDPVEACRRVARLEAFDLAWVEEPVRAEDLAGHARVRAASAIPVQTGENWWFPRDMQKAIAAGACDFAMLDVMKIGGVTGWLQGDGPGGGGVAAGVEPHLRRGERASPGGHADGASGSNSSTPPPRSCASRT